MEFESFEHALQICVTAEQGSDEQEIAMIHCLQHAPEDLKEQIKNGLTDFYKAREEKQNKDGNCGNKTTIEP